MINISLLALALCSGVLVEPFRIAERQPDHHQTYACAAMAPDGHFAVAWVDNITSGDPYNPDNLELELFIRFFDRDGNPMTEAYKIAKLADTSWIRHPCLEMDTAGNTILLWADKPIWRKDELWYAWYVRFQRFAPDGSPVGSAHTLVAHVLLGKHTARSSPIDLSLNNNEEFVVTWCEIESGPPILNYVWVQRFDLDGYPKNQPFLTCDAECVYSYSPRVALNDAGDVAVTWLNEIWGQPDSTYQRFQVFDAADEPVLSWRPRGHLLDEREDGGREPQLFWLDNDRFVAFFRGLEGFLEARVFAHRGLASYPRRLLITDPYGGWTWEKRFSVAFSFDERFAETHLRYSKLHEEPDCWWMRPGGIIGEIRDNQVWRQTNIFEYTLPFGIDTTWKAVFVPAAGACDDRIVWVYPHSTPDSLCEAWALISDWDMGVGVAESPIQTESPIKLEASINRLSYDVSGSVTGEASLTLYSADGRRVLEETIKGEGIWQAPKLPSGVYFARVEGEAGKARAKVVILH
ncbi:hypothetical protein ES703_12427 [subsurface metagenome]|nr:T9SS type A sorting domain-containing protein [bacterium]